MKDRKVGTVLKTETKVIAIVVICLVILVLGISYALFFEVKGNEKNQIVKAGTLEFSYANGSQITNATNSECFIPMNNEEALSHSECEYKISITNTGTLPGNYNINLSSESVENPLALSKLKIILKKEGQVVADYPKEGTTTRLVENEKIEAGKVINYSVQVYVDKELVDANDDEKNISIKINGDAVVNNEEVNPPMLAADYIKTISTTESGDGLYTVSHNNLEELGSEWNQAEYRYAGVNPNNYVRFNNEIWRIIGLVNVKTEKGIEQRVKIVRTDKVNGQKDFNKYCWDTNIVNEYRNNWTTSKLKDMLNGIYYESGIGECYIENENNIQLMCNFTGDGDLPVGLNETARNMIDKEVIWNIGGSSTRNDVTANMFYERERGLTTGDRNNHPAEWSSLTDVGKKYNGIGLIYPSDYGYATNGGNIGREECLNQPLYTWFYVTNNYQSECAGTSWLKPIEGIAWTLTPNSTVSRNSFFIFDTGDIHDGREVNYYGSVWPTLYLKSSIKILPNSKSEQEYGSINNPFVLQ